MFTYLLANGVIHEGRKKGIVLLRSLLFIQLSCPLCWKYISLPLSSLTLILTAMCDTIHRRTLYGHGVAQ